MKKRYFLIFCILLLLIIASTFLYCVQFFYSPGVHKLGKIVHYNVFDSAYIIGSSGRRVNLTFCGTYDGKAHAGGCGSFRGAIEVAAYPVPYDTATGFITNDGRGILFTRHSNYITAKYYAAVINEEGYLVQAGYQYTVILNLDAPEEIIIVIYEENGNPVAIAVNGSSQEVSELIYHNYLQAIQQDIT